MPSQIDTTNIDTNYPVGGQQQSTQKFRTNFSEIKDALDQAKAEIDLKADWNQTDATAVDFIKNKPTIPAAQVNSDWTATSGSAEILNKPFIPAALTDLSDVAISGTIPDGYVVKWNQTLGKWEAANPTTLTNLDSLSDVAAPTATNGQVLRYNGTAWAPAATVDAINDLNDVTVSGLLNGDFLRWDTASSQWKNQPDLPGTTLAVKIVDDGSGTGQGEFEIAGTKITLSTLSFAVGNRYRFDLSDVSNSLNPLRFSTTPDTVVPGTITDYNTGVTRVGTAGQAGSYVEIAITKDTPNVLYLYAERTGGVDTNKIGKERAILVNLYPYTGVEDLQTASAASLTKSVSAFATGGIENATLAAGAQGQIKTFIMTGDAGDMTITVANAGWKTSGTGIMTFSNTGDSCTLQYINDKWYCIGNNGAVFA